MWKRRRSSRVAAIGLATLLATALGCSDDPVGPTTADFQREREASQKRIAAAQKNKAKNAARKAAAPAAPAEAPDQGAPGSVTKGYVYDSVEKRDPFRNFKWERPDRLIPVAESGPLEQFDLNQLEVVAVIWRTGNARALVEDPSGESYIIGEGAAIGKNQGHVVSIADNLVIVKEIYVDYLGQETTKDIEMRMRRNEGG